MLAMPLIIFLLVLTIQMHEFEKQVQAWDQGVVKYTYNTKIMDRAQQLKEEKKKAEEGRR